VGHPIGVHEQLRKMNLDGPCAILDLLFSVAQSELDLFELPFHRYKMKHTAS
jgi:hypothetical protein